VGSRLAAAAAAAAAATEYVIHAEGIGWSTIWH